MRLLRALLPFALIGLVTLLAYGNARHNSLVLDDRLFINTGFWSDTDQWAGYFGDTLWETGGGSEPLYRPLLQLSVSIDAYLFEDNFKAWHSVNIALHLVVSLLFFIFARQLLVLSRISKQPSTWAALGAALVFAVHPVHTEVVNSVFNRSDMLACLFVLAGCICLNQFLRSRPWLAWLGAFFAYSAALFCKEIAIVMPGILAMLAWTHSEGDWRRRTAAALPVLVMLVPMILYLYLRQQALSDAAPAPVDIAESFSSDRGLDLFKMFQPQRLLDISGSWFKALLMMIWPSPLVTSHDYPGWFAWAGLLVHPLLMGLAFWQAAKGKYAALVSLGIFYLALLPSSRLLGGGNPHFAMRYVYLASTGLLIWLAFGLNAVYQRADRLLAAAPVLLAVFVFVPITWQRNSDWSDHVRLLEVDYKEGVATLTSLRLLTGAHLINQETARVVEICDRRPPLRLTPSMYSSHCGTAYKYANRLEDAEQAFLHAAENPQARARAYSNLGSLYIRRKNIKKADEYFRLAIENEANSAMKLYRQGSRLQVLYSTNRASLDKARQFFEQALEEQPGLGPAINGLRRNDWFRSRLDEK